MATNTPTFVRTANQSNGSLANAGSLVLNNAKLVNVPVAVSVLNGPTILLGTSPAIHTKTIDSWVQGNVFKGSNSQGPFTQGYTSSPSKPRSLLGPDGKIVSRTHPQYADHDVSDFVSARDHGAVGDGVTDDTQALQKLFNKVGDDLNDYNVCLLIIETSTFHSFAHLR